jgi:hypothetical protein
MNDLEQEAQMIFETIKWWDNEVAVVLERLSVLNEQEPRDEKEIIKLQEKLHYLFIKGKNEIKNVDTFFEKWDLDK